MPATASRRAPQQQGAPQQLIPFTAAAHKHVEPAFTTQTVTPGAAAATLGPLDVAAFGYVRNIVLEISATGGTLGAGVFHPDAPWNLFQSITLFDVNGAPIYGPLSGYQALWAQIVGGYAWAQDPRQNPFYTYTTSASNFNFYVRIPVEITAHNALGALANQNAAAAYKLQLVVNPSAAIYTTAPTTVPSFSIKGWLEAWTLPSPGDMAGRPQAQIPPAHGTTGYHSVFKRSVVNGNNTLLLPRVGNLLRNVVCITRNNTAQGSGDNQRDATVFPSNPQLVWDARMLYNESSNYRQIIDYEVVENLKTLDTGVYYYNFANGGVGSGRNGDEDPNLWLPTVQATRLELDGNTTNSGTIEIITNDVAPVEVVPAERYVEQSATGFHPQVGVSGPAVQ